MPDLVFPQGFLWGSAGSAHQTEGANTNSDWWLHETAPGTNAAEPSGDACDSYHRFAEEWRLVAGSGQNAVRFSIEWARIEPSPGEFSTEALDHYREVIGTARDLGLTTFVTLHHFTNPIWFAEKGSWEDEESPQVFARYVGAATRALDDLLEVVNTINEPQVVASAGYVLGYFPPRKKEMDLGMRVTRNLIRAHAAAVEEVRAATEAKVGIALAVADYLPMDESPETKEFTELVRHAMVGVYLEALSSGKITGLTIPDTEVPQIAGTDDFVGIQYYSKTVVDPVALGASEEDLQRLLRRGAKPDDRLSQMGWVWHPEGMGKVIEVAAGAGLPIYVTENGVATDDDDERIEYVTLHLEQVHASIQRGADVRGYFYWSYIDNFEWNLGYYPKFGLVACDRKTFERTPKPSLSWYGTVAKSNRLTI